jgi:ABC-type phosphate transport system auxiliary subunit
LSVSDFNPAAFQSQLTEEIRPYFQAIYLEATSLDLEPKIRLREIKKIVSQISILNLKNRINQLSQKIAQDELSRPDDAALSSLETEYNLLLKQLASLQSKKV